MATGAALGDDSWSSAGLARRDAIRQWQDWAADTIAPIDVSVRDTTRFAARWRSRGLGQLRFLHLAAPAQRVVHRGTAAGAGAAAPSIQLVYARRGVMATRVDGAAFALGPGGFVLLDNTRFYRMDMDGPHEALDLMMPRSWLERWLPDPDALLARPLSARTGWGRPLGSLLETVARSIDANPRPRTMIAEQVGALLMLAGGGEAAPGPERATTTQRILQRIDRGHADPELAADGVAGALGISKRHLQALLAARGTSFVAELTATRLERAAALLAAAPALPVSEVAFRCGFLDAGYFTRRFRTRFGTSPRAWRKRG